MKIAYITAAEILGPQNTGGIQCCSRNLNILKQAFGERNVYVCAITKHKEHLSKSSENTKVFYSGRSKLSILKNSLSGRLQFGKSVENAVLNHVKSLRVDVVFIEFSRMGFLQEQFPKGIRQILFMHNIETEYVKNLIHRHPAYIVLKKAFKRNEALAVKHADAIISLNYRDAEKLNQYYGKTPDLILPISMDDEFVRHTSDKEKSQPQKLQLLFVGSLFPPNEQGVTWFAKKVMPHINAEFTIVGRDFEKLKGKLQKYHSNIKVIGTVDDPTHYYHYADAVVSPIHTGAGMKVKTAEALMYGKPMFATDEALEGYDVDGQKNIFRCNSPQDFISAINNYAENPPYTAVDEDIRTLFLDKYHTPNYMPIIHETIVTAHGLPEKIFF